MVSEQDVPVPLALSAVVPIFDERECAAELLRRLRAALETTGRSWEIVVVDDHSSDGTPEILLEAAGSDARIRVLRLERHAGQSAALDAGFRAARGEWIVTLDADLQNPPEEIGRLLAAADGVDMVYGRRERRNDTWVRRAASRIGNGVRNAITGHAVRDTGCSLKLMRGSALARIPRFNGAHRFLPTLFAFHGFAIREVGVAHEPRRGGRSKYGNLSRAAVGLLDCFGVRWLRGRALSAGAVELTGDGPVPAATTGDGAVQAPREAAAGAPSEATRSVGGRGAVLLLLVLSTFAVVPSLFTRDLWNPDEPRYAEVSAEVLTTGSWAVMHLNGDVYSEKPPLFFWLSAVLQALGVGIVAGRLVSGAALTGTVLLTYGIGRRLAGERAGLLAGAALATSVGFAWLGRVGVLDVPLALCTTLAVWAFLRHRRAGGAWIVLFYGAIGLGVLTKGPVALMIAAFGALALAFDEDGWRGLRARHPLWGLPLIAAMVATWLLGAWLGGHEDYVRTLVVHQNVGRVASSFAHRQPPWYYLVTLPVDLAPWSLFLPAALYAALRRNGEGRRVRPAALWLLLGFVAFSLISGKRERYLLPLFPAAAVLIGAWLDRALAATPERSRWARRLLAGQAALLVPLSVALLMLAGAARWLAQVVADDDADLAEVFRALAHGAMPSVLGAGALIGGAAALYAAWAAGRGRLGPGVGAIVVAMTATWMTADLALAPAMDRVKSPRPVAERLVALSPPGVDDPVALYPGEYAGAFNLYAGHRPLPVLHDASAIDAFLAADGPRSVLTEEVEYRAVADELSVEHGVVDAGRVGRRAMIFLVNPAATGLAAAGLGSTAPDS